MKLLTLVIALFCTSPITWAQNRSNFMAPGAPLFPDSPFQIHHVSNLGLGDTVITLINTNVRAAVAAPTQGTKPAQEDGQLCANFYAFSYDATLISCCSCNVPASEMFTLSAKNDFASNTLSPTIPDSMVVKMAVTEGGSQCKGNAASNVTGAAFLAQADRTVAAADPFQGRTGLVAWARNLRSGKSGPAEPGNGGIEFLVQSSVGQNEMDRISGMCAALRKSGSGYGICKSCKLGGISPSAK